MKRMILTALAAGMLLAFAPLPVHAAEDAPGVMEKYARKLKWFHTEANPGQKIEVIEAALMAAKAGVADAQLYLAYAYIEGVGVERNKEKGMELLREAARNGSEDARQALTELEEDVKAPAPEILPDPLPEPAP